MEQSGKGKREKIEREIEREIERWRQRRRRKLGFFLEKPSNLLKVSLEKHLVILPVYKTGFSKSLSKLKLASH